ncbi:CLUMA_CG003947, isoform A [Clunio marinus]|uniref:CLUMA_CG003947, isoform A n=1 Tax=Clunio marinus TaxID=568069 RepID=A0A1J1HRT1_9DIPT|nr:CLUMA_CG003947, isoform A [Clunio marinus]
MKFWESETVNEIICYGDINFRKQQNKLRCHTIIKPPHIKFRVYTKRAKVFTDIGTTTKRGIFNPKKTDSLVAQMNEMIVESNCIIFTYCGQSYAIWKEQNAFYVLNSEDVDRYGKLVMKSSSGGCVMRSSEKIDEIVQYLVGVVKVPKKLYDIYSFKISRKVVVEEEIKSLGNNPKEPSNDAKPDEIEKKQNFYKSRQTGFVKEFSKTLFEEQPQPSFPSPVQPSHGFLQCNEYLSKSAADKRIAPFISCAALAMLRICKSTLWKTSTLKEIFNIGREIFTENVEEILLKREEKQMQLMKDLADLAELVQRPEEDEIVDNQIEEKIGDEKPKKNKKVPKPEKCEKSSDIPITEISPIATIKCQQFEIITENIIFGKVLNRGRDILSISDGIKALFKQFDLGLIQGPEDVAIWREKNLFFMFDPCQCNEFRNSFEDECCSCLSWFGNVEDLIKLYIEKVPKEFRNSVFKIAKVDVHDYRKKSDNWKNFKAIGLNKWILSGKISESSDLFKESNRNHQGTCISVVALVMTRELGLQSWTTETVDEIVQLGDEFHSGSILSLESKGELIDSDLRLSELGNELKLQRIIVDLLYEECIINGSLLANDSSDDNLTLCQGLKTFFENDDLGVLTCCGVSLAIWRHSDAFYLFDSHGRDEQGRNLKVVDPIHGCMIAGSACVLRFLSVNDLACHLKTNMEVGDVPDFNISRIDVSVRSTTTPCLYNYKKLGNGNFAAILKAFDNFHEDCEDFRSNLSQKTFCNLIACMCFSRVLGPRFWTTSDVKEILKIGYKVLCSIAGSLTADSDEPLWSLLGHVDISSMKMKLEMTRQESGTFSGRKHVLASAENSRESLEENFNISEIDPRSSKRSMNFPDDSQSITSMNEHPDDCEATGSLAEILKQLEQEKEVFGILSSDIFNIAVFKLDRFYFVFDPKASDENGKLIRKRLEMFLKRTVIEERSKLYEQMNEFQAKQRSDEGRKSVEADLQEVQFGRQFGFPPPLGKPSMNILATGFGDDSISDIGSAYVAWFSSVELLHQHIMDKMPNSYHIQTFTFDHFTILNTKIVNENLERWNNFEPVSSTHWILRASMSQNDTQFADVNRNHQDIPNAIIALTFSQLCSLNEWNSTVVDIILKLGDRLYKKSLKRWMKSIGELPENLRMSLDQVDLPVFIRPFIVTVKDEFVKRDLTVKSHDKEPMEGMKDSLLEFLSADSGILSGKDYHVAIWKSDDGNDFMMFDPHDIGPEGIRRSTGVACLHRFTDHKKLVEIFCSNVKELEGVNEYQLTRVSIVKTHFEDSRDDREADTFSTIDDDYNLYTTTSNVRSIRSKDATTIEWTKENVAIGVCYAVAMLCLSRSLEPEYYTHDIIDKIIVFGNDLIKECSDNCFIDFQLCEQNLCPDEINWNFELNNVQTNIQMDIFQRGIVSKLPCPAPRLRDVIEEFFTFYSVGVLVTQSFVVAIWKERNEFFIFYSCPIDDNGNVQVSRRIKIEMNTKTSPGLIILKSVSDLYQNIIGNIDRDSFCKPFELRVCNITMTDLDDTTFDASPELLTSFNEEEILPAVSANVTQKQKELRRSNNTDEYQKLIKEIKAKKGNSGGFIEFSKGSLICGKLSTSSKSLNEYARKYHAGAICLLAVAMSSVKELNCWNGNTINNVVKSGSNLYIESSVANDTKDVTMSMLITSFNFCELEVFAKIESFKNIPVDNLERDFLTSTLTEFFSCYENGYLCRGLECWAVFKRCKSFYIFDPQGIEINDRKRYSVLYKFDSVDLLVEQILKYLEDSEELCTLGAILCCANLPKDEGDKEEKVVKPKKKSKFCKKTVLKVPSANPPQMILKELNQKRSETLCPPNTSHQISVKEFFGC